MRGAASSPLVSTSRACLSLLTAVCLAWPPAASKAAEPAAAADEPANTEPANTEPDTEPTPETVPLYLNPASTQDPARPNAGGAADRLTSREAEAREEQQFFRASEAAGIPVNSGVGLLSAGITTSLIGLPGVLDYAIYPATPWPSYGSEDDPDLYYVPSSPLNLIIGLPTLAAGVAMTTVGSIRLHRYRAAVATASARGQAAAARGQASPFAALSDGPPPPSGYGMLISGTVLSLGGIGGAITSAFVLGGSTCTGEESDCVYDDDAGGGIPGEVFLFALTPMFIGAGVSLTAVGAIRRARRALWLRSRYEALGPPPPSISLHSGAVAPMSIRPGVTYGRPVRTYGFQLRF